MEKTLMHSDKMKILFVLGFTNPFPGAGWTRISSFAQSWVNKGHLIEILGVFSYSTFSKKKAFSLGNINFFNLILRLGDSNPFIFLLNCAFSFFVSILYLLIRTPNVTIISVPSGDVGIGALMACKLLRTSYVVDYRDEWEDYLVSVANSRFASFFYSVVKKLSSYLYINSKLVITVTSRYREFLRKRGVDKVKLILNGADTTIFKPSANKNNRKIFTLLYSGGIGGYYRLDVIIRALKILVDDGFQNFKLVIAGAGQVQEILNLANELDVTDKIAYIGSINNVAELVSNINVADIGLIPYDDNVLWKNSLPAKFFEYCSCGIPVIATAYEDSLIADLINNYQIGLITPPKDEIKLAEAIEKIYANKNFRLEAGQRARRLIESKYDRNKIAEDFFVLINGRV